MESVTKSISLDIKGVVQGVGLRPTIYNLAKNLQLRGHIQNRHDCVRMNLEGALHNLNHFIRNLNEAIPALASIEKRTLAWVKPQNFNNLTIIESAITPHSDSEVNIPTDLATCQHCTSEFFDRSNRRHHFPFNSCTFCGPRYSLITNLPYDRRHTTMDNFPLCSSCTKEYENSTNRRFHAESISCHRCGPSLQLLDKKGEAILENTNSNELAAFLQEKFKQGSIVAIKGLSGYQICCDATSTKSIEKLRERKNRPHQAFAIMARHLDLIRNICQIKNSETIKYLTGEIRSIAVLPIKESCPLPQASIAPDTNTLGVMLPSTLLHHLLFGLENKKLDYLVMTSGNRHNEPICHTNHHALSNLSGIADYYLNHNRQIIRSLDDSIVSEINGRPQVWRRARGLTPKKMKVNKKFSMNILAMGADLKNSCALAFDENIVFSTHIGNLSGLAAYKNFRHKTRSLPKFFNKSPELIAVDMHPNYYSSEWGADLAKKYQIPLVKVNHHHAHAVSCMVENNLEEAIAAVFDGAGYGSDGTLWGGEFFHISLKKSQLKIIREGHFAPSTLVGGDQAVKEPWRQALIRLVEIDRKLINEQTLSLLNIEEKRANSLLNIYANGKRNYKTTSAGRLFDSAAAILNLGPAEISYEAQLAIRLEKETANSQLYFDNVQEIYPFSLKLENGRYQISTQETFRQILEERKSSVPTCDIAYKFHTTIAMMSYELINLIQQKHQTKNVVLSGGVFQNRLLNSLLKNLLSGENYSVNTHQTVPPNDGGIALGQALIADYHFNRQFAHA